MRDARNIVDHVTTVRRISSRTAVETAIGMGKQGNKFKWDDRHPKTGDNISKWPEKPHK